MKLSESRLRSIIREELSKLNESQPIPKPWLRQFMSALDRMGAQEVRAPKAGAVDVDGYQLDIDYFDRDEIDIHVLGDSYELVSASRDRPEQAAREVMKVIQ